MVAWGHMLCSASRRVAACGDAGPGYELEPGVLAAAQCYPELIPATLLGYAWGPGLLGAGSAIIAAGRRWFNVPYPPVPIADFAFQQQFPWAAPLLPIGFALVLSAIILFATGSMQRRRGMLRFSAC